MRLWALAAAWACGGLRGDCGPGVCLAGRCYCQAPFSGPRCAGRVELPALAALEQPETEVAPAPDPCAAGAAPALARLCRRAPAPAVPAAPVPPTAAPLARPEARVREPRVLTPDHPIPRGITTSRWARDAEVLLMRDVDSPVVDAIETVNTTARFLTYVGIFALLLVVAIGASVLWKSHQELQRRIMFFVSGDTKVRMNVPDAFGAWVLPGKVVRIEKMIVLDVDSGFFGLDLYCEVDWGCNMLQSTRVRQVQPVGQMLAVDRTIAEAKMPCAKGCPLSDVSKLKFQCEKCTKTAVFGCKKCDYYVCDQHSKAPRPEENQTVFTDHLEFNVRPYGQDSMKIRVADQDIIGNECMGTLELTNDEVLELAYRSIGRPLDMSTVGVFTLSLNGSAVTGGKGTPTRLLIWITLVDEYGHRVMEG